MIELIALSGHLPKDAVVSNSTQGKFIPITKLSETLEVDWFDDGVLGAGVGEAVAEFLADGFPVHTRASVGTSVCKNYRFAKAKRNE